MSYLSLFFLLFVSTQALADTPKGPKPLTVDEAVGLSSFVAVGKVTRVFFTKDGIEASVDPDNPRYFSTWLEVEVKKTLFSKEGNKLSSATINFPSGSYGEQLRAKYLDKDFIFFVQVVRTRRNANGVIAVDEHMRFTQGRQMVFPYPMEALDEVSQSIESAKARNNKSVR